MEGLTIPKLFAFLFILLSPNLLQAQEFLVKGTCFIVLASKSSADLAIAEAEQKFWNKDVSIFRKKNGTHVVTWKKISRKGSKKRLKNFKTSGEIPQDAECKNGKNYVSKVMSIKKSAARTVRQAAGNEKTDIPIGSNEPSAVDTVIESALDGKELQAPFDANLLSANEKFFLQLALTFEGDYQDYLDGVWGSKSVEAIRKYSAREFNSVPLNLHAVALFSHWAKMFERDQWKTLRNEATDISLFFPADVSNDLGRILKRSELNDNNSSMRIVFRKEDRAETIEMHTFSFAGGENGASPVVVEKRDNSRDMIFSTVKTTDGDLIHIRSYDFGSWWSTVIVSAGSQDVNLFRGVVASLSTGLTPDREVESDGYLTGNLKKAKGFITRDERLLVSSGSLVKVAHGLDPLQNSVKTQSQNGLEKDQEERTIRGAGFVVAANGLVLTNDRSIKGCKSITIENHQAQVLSVSPVLGLALLKSSAMENSKVAHFSRAKLETPVDVTVASIQPTSSADPEVVSGVISEVKINGDAVHLQLEIDKAVESAGSPVFDSKGLVIGIVAPRKNRPNRQEDDDLTKVFRHVVGSDLIKLFLKQNNVEPSYQSDLQSRLKPEAFPADSSEYTRSIACFH